VKANDKTQRQFVK